MLVSALGTIAVAVLHRWVPAPGVGVAYLAGVLLVSSRYGLVPGVTASVVSMLAFNFFFLPPLHTFVIRASSDWLTLGLLLITALVTSQLAARAHDATERAEHRALEAEAGLTMTRALVVAPDLASVVPTLAAESARVLGAGSARARLGATGTETAGALPLVLDGVRSASSWSPTTPPPSIAASPSASQRSWPG